MKRYVQKRRLNVTFLGTVPNEKLPGLISRYDLFVLPSFYENNPKSLLEAMSCGVPVLGTNVAGIRDIIVDNQNGVLCDTDHASLRSTIRELMEDGRLRRKLGANARATALSCFSFRTLAEKELTIHLNLLGDSLHCSEN